MKRHLYNLIAHSGIWFLQTCFPEYFGVEPLQPTDRFIEYPFVFSNLGNAHIILDVGCSGSMLPLLLKSLNKEVYGLDIRNYYPEYKIFFYQGSIAQAPFKSDYFDLVTAVSSIEHIGLKGRYGNMEDDIDSDLKALKEIHRILKPNGRLLMTVPCNNNLKITKDHKIYNELRLRYMLEKFRFEIKYEQSPEANYKIALIKAYKYE